jgi:E3 SUMO-protein ligase PIAS1
VVEADGEWHTSDNKYSSATWKSTHPATRIIKPPSTPRKSLSFIKSPSHTPARPASGIVAGNGKAKANDEIVVLDSDDEDEGRVKRELSPSHGSGSSVSVNRSFDGTSVPRSHTDDVIDLTLESDDEEPPMSTQPRKRKASVAGLPTTSTELIWKKGRTVDHTSTMMAIPPTTPRNANGRDHPRHPHHAHNVARPSAPSSPPIRYAPQYPGTSLPHIYSTFPPRGAPAAAAPQLPPLNSNTFLPQLNGSSNSRWS